MTKPKQPLGVLLINLGTPDEPTAPAIRRYLAEFLSDQRVVNLPKVLWRPILYGFILPLRPRRLVENYEYIWQEDGGPIRTYTAALAKKLEAHLGGEQLGRNIRVVDAMTYGNPRMIDVIAGLRDEGVDDLLLVPMFPQYSAATTAAVFDKFAAALKRTSRMGDIRFVDEYCMTNAYIHAITKSIEDHIDHLDGGARLLFSFHGIPMSQVEAGDPYPDRCRATAAKIAQTLGLREDQWMTTFQSRFGPAPWLEPYTDKSLAALPGQGIKKVMVVCPGFSADCLETLHEIQVEGRDEFLHAGGEQFTYIPALNASDEHVKVIAELVKSRLYPVEQARD